jgi:biopolymer transport protein ExbD
MSFHKSIRFRRGRRTIHKDFELQLTSMLDILVIILVFLLKTYTTSTNSMASVKGIELPVSKSFDSPQDTIHLMVTPQAIFISGLTDSKPELTKPVVEFRQTAESLNSSVPSYEFKREDLKDGVISPLFAILDQAALDAKNLRLSSSLRDQDNNPVPFNGTIAIQADKRVKYEILRKIMFTAGQAGFGTIRLLARQEDQ